MTFSACGEKKATQNTEEAIPNTDYTLVTTPTGAKGIKKGDAVLIEPKADYKDISVAGGMFIAKTEAGQVLLDPKTGYSRIEADTLIWKDFFFEGQRGTNYIVFIPAYNCQFAAQAYEVKGSYAIALFNDKFTIWKDGEQLIEPNGEYSRIAILSDGSLLCCDNLWGTGKITKDKLILPGKAVTPKEFKKYKAMKGWSDSAECMILE